jgi:hypothetical protein
MLTTSFVLLAADPWRSRPDDLRFHASCSSCMCVMYGDQPGSTTVAGRTRLLLTVSVPIFAPIFAAERVMLPGYLARSTGLDGCPSPDRLLFRGVASLECQHI